jgi:hypothetical protein
MNNTTVRDGIAARPSLAAATRRTSSSGKVKFEHNKI